MLRTGYVIGGDGDDHEMKNTMLSSNIAARALAGHLFPFELCRSVKDLAPGAMTALLAGLQAGKGAFFHAAELLRDKTMQKTRAQPSNMTFELAKSPSSIVKHEKAVASAPATRCHPVSSVPGELVPAT